MNANSLIKSLELNPHPEGGYYKELFRSSFDVKNTDGNSRSALTSIYYLLEEGDFSALHRIKSDEIWYYHAGEALNLVAIDSDGLLRTWVLGADILQGQVLQVVMEAGWIFGASCQKSFSLVGCAVAPGFHFDDFEMLSRADLLQKYPNYISVIEMFTR